MPSLTGKRAAVILYGYYPTDTRVHRSTEALVQAGMKVDLLCLTETPAELRHDVVEGANVFRVQMIHKRDSKLGYIWLYARFFLSAFWFLSTRSWQRRYDVVHVHNMPDFLVFSALVPKLQGGTVILDLHDPMPELMSSIYEIPEDNWKIKVLRLIERASIAFSDFSITPNISFKNVFASRSCAAAKMLIVMNTPDAAIFDPSKPPPAALNKSEQEFRLMHHGSIVHRHGVDLLVEAVARLHHKIPGLRLDIYGWKTPFLDTVLKLAAERGVADLVRYHGAKTEREIVPAIQQCDLGVVPNRRSAFTDINFPTRLFEYLAMHKTVIGPATRGVQDYFSNDEMLMFAPGDVDSLAEKIEWAYRHRDDSARIAGNGRRVYEANMWTVERERFLSRVAAPMAA